MAGAPRCDGRRVAAVDASPDRAPALRDIQVPTTIARGDADRPIAPIASAELHNVIPDSTLTTYPGMGHELLRPLWDDLDKQIRGKALRTN
ncbi:alpha/beta fold hydrolase [Streptomyces sp. NPDC057474]|uniref:alpha/beta fold hydrolase n=1 Tax=Streptomyces sp. NPDC057474 TaxID=3346144 RepID=UPI0036AC1329